MYPGNHAKPRADQAAFVMARSGEAVTYAELEARTNRLAHFLRSRGLKRLDHYSIFMENNARYIECCGAGERSGLYFTCINSFLTADELAYIVNNSESKALIFSEAMRAVAIEAFGIGTTDGFLLDRVDGLASSQRDAAQMLWTRTEMTLSDMDFGLVYDGFSFLALRWLEELGCCAVGEGGERGSFVLP